MKKKKSTEGGSHDDQRKHRRTVDAPSTSTDEKDLLLDEQEKPSQMLTDFAGGFKIWKETPHRS